MSFMNDSIIYHIISWDENNGLAVYSQLERE